ncbi:MAG: Gfo/Idh/MocA family protein [Planctomycetaceae bacterium]
MPHDPSRRLFLRSAAATAGLLAAGRPCRAQVLGANDRVRIAVLGLNGRGKAHLKGFAAADNVEIAAVVDPDALVLGRTLETLRQEAGAGGVTTAGFADFRRVLDDPRIDAVSIAAPNHWHSLMTILAAQAGKHVYVEKPLSHDVAEGRVAVAAAARHGVVVQHGTQRRSDADIAGLHAALKDGRLPRLRIAHGICCKPRDSIGFREAGDAPATLDWSLWKGPAVIDRYHANLVPYNWHWFWKTGNGDLNNQGTHQLDVASWAIDDDQVHPVRAAALGGRFAWRDQGETPNTLFAMAEYANGQRVLFTVRNVTHEGFTRRIANEYHLEDGSVIVGEGPFRIRRPGTKEFEPLEIAPGRVTAGGPWQSFVTAVRAGDPRLANGGVQDAHRSCVLGHLMNNSYRLGVDEPFNERALRFGDQPEVAECFLTMHAAMRDGVGIPEDGTTYRVGPMLTFDPVTERHTGDHAAEADRLLKDPNTPGFEVPALDRV